MAFALAFALAGCAAKTPPVGEPARPPLDAVQLRACESCRQDLEICRRSAATTPANPNAAACMDQFMACVTAQQLDSAHCSGI